MQLRRATLAGAFVALAAVLILGDLLLPPVGPARIPSEEEAIAHFEQLAFVLEGNAHRLPLRWLGPVSIVVVGAGADRAFESAEDWVWLLASLTGLRIEFEAEAELANLVVLVTTRQRREAEARELGIGVLARLSLEDLQRGFSQRTVVDNGMIRRGFVFVPSDSYDVSAILLHELIHALGFPGHSDAAGRSVMATVLPVAPEASVADMIAIRTLYDPRFEVSLGRAAMPVAREIIEELLSRPGLADDPVQVLSQRAN